LAEANAAYERRFGHVFLLCATGLNARAMLDALARRVGNEPAEELAIAAAEQRKITRLRLAKLAAAPNDDGAIPPS
jgi:2-oxo-4-hydroxy-4-carboxy-5-ureidoimidazoline decarboxylase